MSGNRKDVLRGNRFPVAPAQGMEFYRSDRDMWYRYDVLIDQWVVCDDIESSSEKDDTNEQ